MPRVVVPAEAVGEARLARRHRGGARCRRGRGGGAAARAADAPAAATAPAARDAARRSTGTRRPRPPAATDAEPAVDLVDVRGQAVARRALEIALAGGHALLLLGPPGAGKTLLARTIPGLLPDLDDEAALAATVVASVAADAPGRGARAAATGQDAPPHDARTPGWSAAVRGCRPAR